MAARSPESKSASFPFLRLSAELRNRIYEEAFDGTIISDTATITPLDSGYGIILACKQTYAEALGLYYNTHAFRFSNDSYGGLDDIINRCDRWLGTIGQDSAQILKRIELDLAPRFHCSLPRQGRNPYWRERAMDLAATAATTYIRNRMANHRLRHGVVLASICSPLHGDHFTADPMMTLGQHREVFRLGRHDLQGARQRRGRADHD